MNPNLQGSNRRLLIFKFLVPLLACVVTLGFLELALSVGYPVPFSTESNMYFEPDPYTGYRLKPGSVGYYQNGILAITNSHGHRDNETPLKKPAGTFRILVLGDSFTVGANVQQHEAYPKALEGRLRQIYGQRIQVVNSGVGGWEPFQYAQYFEHYGRLFEPDLVVVGFFVGNDTFNSWTKVEELPTAVLGQRVSKDATAQPFLTLKIFLYERSHLARLLLTRGPLAPRDFVRKQCDDFSEWYLALQNARISNHLRYSGVQQNNAQNAINQLRRIRDAAGTAPVVVALLPDENQVNVALQRRILDEQQRPQYDFLMPQSMLSAMFDEVKIPTIDVLPTVLADNRCLYMNDTHWTPEGHELVGSAIADKLIPILEKFIK